MKTIGTSHLSNDKRRTVLLIGDSLGILKRVAFALQHCGDTVIWAECGQEGLSIAECEAPDLIISEIGLPDISGFEICKMIKANFLFETPVVLVGKPGDEERDSPRALEVGADDYFATFTDGQLVLAKLERLLQRRFTLSEYGERAETAKQQKAVASYLSIIR